MKKRLVITLADLRYVNLHCPRCPAIVTLDMKELSQFQQKNGVFAPKECPGCRQPQNDDAVELLNNFQRAYRELLGLSDRFTFHGTETEE